MHINKPETMGIMPLINDGTMLTIACSMNYRYHSGFHTVAKVTDECQFQLRGY